MGVVEQSIPFSLPNLIARVNLDLSLYIFSKGIDGPASRRFDLDFPSAAFKIPPTNFYASIKRNAKRENNIRYFIRNVSI